MRFVDAQYEESGKFVTTQGWACVHCGAFYGNDPRSEHMAKWCCTRRTPCPCGEGMSEPHKTKCEKCIAKADQEKWYARPA